MAGVAVSLAITSQKKSPHYSRTKRMSSLRPIVCAYFCNVAMEGECLPVASVDSRRATAERFVPTSRQYTSSQQYTLKRDMSYI